MRRRRSARAARSRGSPGSAGPGTAGLPPAWRPPRSGRSSRRPGGGRGRPLSVVRSSGLPGSLYASSVLRSQSRPALGPGAVRVHDPGPRQRRLRSKSLSSATPSPQATPPNRSPVRASSAGSPVNGASSTRTRSLCSASVRGSRRPGPRPRPGWPAAAVATEGPGPVRTPPMGTASARGRSASCRTRLTLLVPHLDTCGEAPDGDQVRPRPLEPLDQQVATVRRRCRLPGRGPGRPPPPRPSSRPPRPGCDVM
jgi:hypothetical protein